MFVRGKKKVCRVYLWVRDLGRIWEEESGKRKKKGKKKKEREGKVGWVTRIGKKLNSTLIGLYIWLSVSLSVTAPTHYFLVTHSNIHFFFLFNMIIIIIIVINLNIVSKIKKKKKVEK